MITVKVGSKNPAKISAVEKGLQDFHVNIEGINVDSGVSNQPFSDEETREGAMNRAKECAGSDGAELGIGLEGGVSETQSGMLLCNWGALADREGNIVTAGGARIFLPEEIAKALREGKELGDVIDAYASRQEVRKAEGTIGIFTSGMMTRGAMFVHIVELLAGQYQYYYRAFKIT